MWVNNYDLNKCNVVAKSKYTLHLTYNKVLRNFGIDEINCIYYAIINIFI